MNPESRESTNQNLRALPFAWIGFAFATALVFIGIAGAAMWNKGATYDEPAHLAAAVDHIERGEYVLNVEHPPLIKQLAGLALLPLDLAHRPPASPGIDSMEPAVHYRAEQWISGRALLRDLNPGRTQAVLRVARVPPLLFAIPLFIALVALARGVAGPVAGAVTALLALLCPNLLAHAPLVHTDFPLAALSVVALALAHRLIQQFSWLGVVGLGCACGLALCTKYSALILGPMIAFSVATHLLWSHAGVYAAKRWAGAALAVIAVSATFALLCSWRWDPLWWLRGFSTLLDGLRPGYVQYALGRYSAEGFWFYYLLALLVKLPVGAWALILAGIVAITHAEPSNRRDVVCFAVVPLCVYHAAAMMMPSQLGIRYVLPTIPLLFLLAGVGGAWLWRGGMVGRIALIALVIIHAGESLRVAPNFLSFFNAAAGGPQRGYLWLDDSNVDWGQNLPALAVWHDEMKREHPEDRLAVSYFGSLPPREWGKELLTDDTLAQAFLNPQWDWMAISAHNLVRAREAIETLGLPFPWSNPERIDYWIEDTYAVFHREP